MNMETKSIETQNQQNLYLATVKGNLKLELREMVEYKYTNILIYLFSQI